MLRIKRLYLFVLQTFLPIFLMTFFISLFILLMQFLWKYVDEFVGKGLSVSVLSELFLYAALSLVPMALPLSILLASLMTFGNIGESLELLSMKSAGISLIRIMRPLIVALLLIAIGSFFFQNNVMPKVQVRLWGLMLSVRQKSPELDIPERVFYDQIDGYNIYIEKKDPKTGILHHVMIYDFSRGFEDAMAIVADSANIKMTEDKKYLVFSIYNGESFENLKKQRSSYNNVPYRRETFSLKQILIAFDANFTRLDNGFLQNQYIGKNISELRHSIDSMEIMVDSFNKQNIESSGSLIPLNGKSYYQKNPVDSAKIAQANTFDVDSLYEEASPSDKSTAVKRAIASANSSKQEFEFKQYSVKSEEENINRHYIEWHKKFTLSFACLIFFFIGAPLGAIIRKGGLGVPVVLSVFLFIVYYIFDSTGYKLARDGRWPPLEGMWLSSVVLLPLGVFLTYKAARDSVILNADTYILFFKKIFGKRKGRELIRKELVMFNADSEKITQMIELQNNLINETIQYFSDKQKTNYFVFWKEGTHATQLNKINQLLEEIIEEANNTANQQIYFKLREYPVLALERYNITPHQPWIRIIIGCLFPIGVPFYFYIRIQQKWVQRDLKIVQRINQELTLILK
ncbi:MAG: LptF/LptG family permease [Bacteroidales bacterium]|nr:LptF/LptG family permease [Bacteroidales bacterium]